jgi:signal transduction histidine kinase
VAATLFAAWAAGILLIDLTALAAARWLLPLGAMLGCSITGHVAAGGAAWLTDRRERLRLEKLEARKQQFTDMLVHDLRNQVAPVSMAIDLLVAKQDTPPYLATAQSSLARMVANLNTLLDIRRTEEGKMPVQRRSTHVGELLNQLHAEYTALAARKDLQFTCHVDPTLAASQLDPDLLRRALENLLLNAVQYAEREKALQLTATAEDGQMILAVQNDGPAIADDHQRRLFNLYEAGDRAERHAFGGSGIGLAFCKEATEAMGGHIRVTSPWREGQGVRIELSFPGDPME